MQQPCFGPLSHRGGDALRSTDLATGLAYAAGGLYDEKARHHGSHGAHELPLEQQEGQATPYHHLSVSQGLPSRSAPWLGQVRGKRRSVTYAHQPKQSGSAFFCRESPSPKRVGMYLQAQLPRDTWQSESE